VAARLVFKSEVAVVKRILAVALALLTLSQNVLADVVVTRSHKRFVGTLENREDLAKNPAGAKSVSLIMDRDGADSASVRSFPLWEIESVILEDGPSKRVVDVVTQHRLQTFRAKGTRGNGVTRLKGPTIAAGLLMFYVGFNYKFGPPKWEVTEGKTGVPEVKKVAEHSYNGSNYVLMIAGSDLTFLGLAMMYADRPAAHASMAGDQKTMYLGASVHF
jgi:hypothetical protein